MTTDTSYLEPRFDPTKLTIAKLKSILSEHGVELPMSNEKKDYYVQLFRQRISSKAADIMRQKERVQPSNAGILNVSKTGSPLHDQVITKSTPRQRKGKGKAKDNFSDENPFQSGTSDDDMSSPVAQAATERKSHSSTRTGRRRVSRPPSRSSTHVRDDVDVPSPDQPLDSPSMRASENQSRGRSTKRESASTPVPDEFKKFMLPSTQLKVAGYANAADVMHVTKSRRRSRAYPSPHHSIQAVATILGLILVGAGALYYYEWVKTPYCHDGEAPHNAPHGTVRHHLALATCRKCPAHGACSEDKLLRCSSNYILEKPLLGMPYCRADTEKLANVEALVSEVKETLAVRAGQIECGEMAGDKVVTEADLSRQLHKNHPKWSDARFNDYWSIVVPQLESDDLRSDLVRVFRSGSRAYYSQNPIHSISCEITMSFLNLVDEFKYYALAIAVLILGVMAFSYNRARLAKRQELLQSLVDSVVELLIQQEQLFRSGGDSQSALSISQLRDFMLHDVKSGAERQKTWALVQAEMMHNSNVRETNILVEGEQHDAWQWIGSMALLKPRKGTDRDTSPSQRPLMSVASSPLSMTAESVYPKLE